MTFFPYFDLGLFTADFRVDEAFREFGISPASESQASISAQSPVDTKKSQQVTPGPKNEAERAERKNFLRLV